MEKMIFLSMFFFFFFFFSALLAAQAQLDMSCFNQLSPCLNYLNATRDPPDSCCDPLKEMIKSDPQCICYMISNQGAFAANMIGINSTEAQELPGRCGQHVNPLFCIAGSPTARNSNQSSSGERRVAYPALLATVMVVLMRFSVWFL